MTGEEFKIWRKNEGLTQSGAVIRFDTSRATIARWESGKAVIPDSVAIACGAKPAEPEKSIVERIDAAQAKLREPRFDPASAGCVRLPHNPRTAPLADPSRWQVIAGCGVVCSALIPDPLPFSLAGYDAADYWAIVCADGRAFHQVTGAELRTGGIKSPVDYGPRPKAGAVKAEKARAALAAIRTASEMSAQK